MIMSWFKKSEQKEQLQQGSDTGIKSVQLRASEISLESLSELSFEQDSTNLILAFVSSNLDFEKVVRSIQNATPFCSKVVAMMTA